MIPRFLVRHALKEIPHIVTDVIVVGAGIAGLFTAIESSRRQHVILITKEGSIHSNTQFAQGGIAAVISADDTPQFHQEDTMRAGAGLCSHEAVNIMTREGHEAVQQLVQHGTHFDLENGEFALTKEAAHSHKRILHAGGDATGAEIIRALSHQVSQTPNIEVWDGHFAMDLITEQGECLGVIVQKPCGQQVFVQGKATVLCTGGLGQMYPHTTNPEVATGDGIAMAYRAGAAIQDMEFIQFHPTALFIANAPKFLISEAVRGEGAILRNVNGERFMSKYHADMELAPRDVVARAIAGEMDKTHSPFVYLDMTHEPGEKVHSRFPTITQFCKQYGLDPAADWIPVAPAAHYMMGGIKTNVYGETNIKRLFACGEVSCTGVHGANRLASNSLLEAVVFARRIVKQLNALDSQTFIPPTNSDEICYYKSRHNIKEQRTKLQQTMLQYVGLRRSREGLERALSQLKSQCSVLQTSMTSREEFELANLLTCALLSTQSALWRQESRGAHYREDFPQCDDSIWKKHIIHHRIQGIVEERIQHV